MYSSRHRTLAAALLALIALPPGGNAQKKRIKPPPPTKEALAKAFLDVLPIQNPKDRDKAIRRLLKEKKAPLVKWEKALHALPWPPLPLSPALERGKRIRRKIPLYTGSDGMLDTEVHGYIPGAKRPERGFALLLASHGTGGQGQHELATWIHFAEGAPMVILAASEQQANQGYRFSEQERQTQLSLLRWARLHLPIDPDRVFVAGTSRGGHISWDLGLRHPGLWAGILPCIGGPRLALQRGQNNLRLLPNLVGVPIHDFQGLKDDPGLIWNLRLAFRELKEMGHKQVHFHTFPDIGHSFDLGNAGLEDFFAKTRRNAHPDSLLLAASRLAEARRSWVQIRGFAREVQDELRLKVRANEWKRLNEEERKRFAHRYAKDRTALVEAKILSRAPLTIRVKAKRARKVRLLLPRWLWQGDKDARLKIRYKGRKRSPKPKSDKFLYLVDFARHLDFDSAPVAYVDL